MMDRSVHVWFMFVRVCVHRLSSNVPAMMGTADVTLHVDWSGNHMQSMCRILACACSGGTAARGSCRWVVEGQGARQH
jgi:hypothetical protein